MMKKTRLQEISMAAPCLFVLLASTGVGASSMISSSFSGAGTTNTPGDAQEVAYGVEALQQWYSQSSGLYPSPSGWWNSANAITVLVNYSRATKTTQYLSAVENTFNHANAANGTVNFFNDYDDDEGWWALAWIDAYDLTGNRKYLAMAQTIFADLAGQWDTKTCDGGIWWNKKTGYKNAIANELFLSVAAALANRANGSREKRHYLAWARREWNWFKRSGMINSKSLINDGLNAQNPAACINNGRKTWTYNQGVILGGLVELYKADRDLALIPQAQAIAKAAIANLSTSSGILNEPSVLGNDAPQFKGIFMRNLMALYAAAPSAEYKAFTDQNARSILANDRGPGHEFGACWQGPFDSADATRQSSALDALIATIVMQ